MKSLYIPKLVLSYIILFRVFQRVIHLCCPSRNYLTSSAVINHAPSPSHSGASRSDLTLPLSPHRISTYAARLETSDKKIDGMKRGQEKSGSKVANQRWKMRSWPMTASVSTPRKRCISTPTRRTTWQRIAEGRRGELTDVSLCHVRYLHYSDIIIPAPLYLTASSLFCSGASGALPHDRVSYDAEFCFISLLHFDDLSFCTQQVHMYMKIAMSGDTSCIDIITC